MTRIFVWRCDNCGRKGATNIPPIDDGSREICFECGSPLTIEVFSDVFLNFD